MAATPTVEQVIDGVYSVLSGIAGLGTILKRDHTLEDDAEFIDFGGYISSGTMNLWIIELEGTNQFEGEGNGESYERYGILVRYWSLRTNNADWQKEARIKAMEAVDALRKNAAVFAIGGQVQLFTPETVSLAGPQPAQIRDIRRGGGQMVMEGVLRLTVEARAW